MGKLHGSLKVIKCDSRGKKSMDSVSNPANCSWACLELSMRRRIWGSRRAVHIKNALRYLRRSKSARRQSTIWGCGDRRYMASMSGLSSLFSSILSISAKCYHKLLQALFMPRTRNVLIENVIFLDNIVYYLLRSFIDDQHLPLQMVSRG